jgi:hypothetical protein
VWCNEVNDFDLFSFFFLKNFRLVDNVVKRVRNRTAQFRCVFSSTDGYGV